MAKVSIHLLCANILCRVLRLWATCLPERITNLQNLDADGPSYPLGTIFGTDGSRKELLSSMLKIVIEDRLGFKMGPVEAGTGINAITALTGCNLTDSEDPICEDTRVHVGVGLIVSKDTETDLISRFKSWMPLKLGAIGYSSYATIRVPEVVWQDAMDSEGLALDYYRNFNASWFDLAKYFDRYDLIPKSDLDRCEDGVLGQTRFMQDYVQRTGDVEAVHPNGTARCPDGFWFFTPACRDNTTRCAPLIVSKHKRILAQALQKSAAFQMAFAVTQYLVKSRQSDFFVNKGDGASLPSGMSQIPLEYKVAFFWPPEMWPSYPIRSYGVEFPAHDPAAFAKGDYRTMMRTSDAAGKWASQDLQRLAPVVVEVISKLTLVDSHFDALIQDFASSGDTAYDVACRWLLANRETWEAWIPDSTACLPGFGLFDVVNSKFVDKRVENLTCVACNSGHFSERIYDNRGITFKCSPCAAGRAQPSGAAKSCVPCPVGEYQDELRAQHCKRCRIGCYQDELGSTSCKNCTANTTTIGLGSISQLECGCREGFIETERDGYVAKCEICQQGLSCPLMSNSQSLSSASLDLSEAPALQKGYMSLEQEPLKVYRCRGSKCPGGLPGECSGRARGIACSTCSSGEYWQGIMCEECTPSVRAAWICAIGFSMMLLPFAQVSRWRASHFVATLVFAALCLWEMGLNLLQTLGIISQMPLDWPMSIQWSLPFLDLFAFEIQELGFPCLTGQDPLMQYSVQASVVPALLLWVFCVHRALKVVPKLQKLHVKGPKLLLLLGQLVMMCFEAVNNFALVPFMCYKHPNGSYSNLHFASVLCGSQVHAIMLLFGLGLLVCVLAFLSLCIYSLWRLPKWSTQGDTAWVLVATSFLTDQFRQDAWWFGLPLLLRGPVLSLTITVFTNEPATQIFLSSIGLCMYILVLLLTWPYKFPLLNALEAFASWSMLLLVLAGSLYLPAGDPNAIDFSSLTTLLSAASAVLAVFGALVLLCIKLIQLKCRKKSMDQPPSKLLHLGTPPNLEELAEALVDTADVLVSVNRQELEERVDVLSSFDRKLITSCIALLSLEVLPRRTSAKWLGRIASQNSFAEKGSSVCSPSSPLEMERNGDGGLDSNQGQGDSSELVEGIF